MEASASDPFGQAGEFYTPQRVSDILSAIVTLDGQAPETGPKKKLASVYDFACGSGSLLLNVRQRVEAAGGSIGRILGQENNVTTYNLARMNMLLHGVKDSEFEICPGTPRRFFGDAVAHRCERWERSRQLRSGVCTVTR